MTVHYLEHRILHILNSLTLNRNPELRLYSNFESYFDLTRKIDAGSDSDNYKRFDDDIILGRQITTKTIIRRGTYTLQFVLLFLV